MQVRPKSFTLDTTASLARGNLFATLGNCSGAVTMYDSSAQKNHGTLTSMDPSADWEFIPELGRWGLDFDGSNDIVSFADVGVANLSLYPKSTVSIWAWIHSTSAGNDMCFGSGYDGGWMLELVSKKLGLFIRNREVSFGSALSTSTWHHLCVVWDDATYTADGYVDGTYIESKVMPADVSIGNRSTLYLGLNGQSSNFPFIGKLSDALLYDRALTTTEIANLADPSNVYLSGLIQGRPRRRYLLPAAPTFSAAWASKTNNLIGGGVG